MLDTIILSIPYRNIQITNYGRFGAYVDDLTRRGKGFRKYENNPTKEEKDCYYFPRLTLIKRGCAESSSVFLKIEFSAPKLIFGNNLLELKDNNLELVTSTLQARIRAMGAIISEEDIRNADVTTVHFSKNILLSNGYTASFVIRELSKLNPHNRFDLDKVDFKNGGESLQVYSNSHSFVIYDKKSDMHKPKKRAVDKDPYPLNQALSLLLKEKWFEILRLEVRLCNRRTILSILKDNGFDKIPLTMQAIFKTNLSKNIVTSHWESLTRSSNSLFVLDVGNKTQNFLRDILNTYPAIKAKQAIYLTGLHALGKDDGGTRSLRSILCKTVDKRSWYRISNDFKKISNILPCHFIREINNDLEKFIPISLSTFQGLQCKEL